jgi:hypothetical protein
MLPFHERLARIGLEALESHGFVLAGGYAISANGIGNRPSADVDLFTNVYEPSLFEISVARLRAAFLNAGLSVHDNLIGRTFADFSVTDGATQQTSSIQVGVNYREFAPARFEVGPVLDVRDGSLVTRFLRSVTSRRRCLSTERCSQTGFGRWSPDVSPSSRCTRWARPGGSRSSSTSSTGPTRSTPPSSADCRHPAE